MQANTIKQHVKRYSEDGYNLEIDVSDKNIVVAGVKVLEVGMYVAQDEDEGDGDLYVTWDMEGLQNDESAQTMGMLLLRNVHSNDEVTAVMGQFYWEHAFDEQLRSILADAGFSEEACADVSTSEWGMQDEGRASYDAYSIAHEVRAAMETETV